MNDFTDEQLYNGVSADELDYYGKPGDDETKTIRQRLRDLYDEGDFVTVQNIDSQPIKYQFAHPRDVETLSAYAGHKDTIQKHYPTVVVLKPGQTKLCPAYEADLMIENLIKQMTSRKVVDQIQEGKVAKWQSANWNDPTTQNDLIGKIYLGKEDALRAYNENVNVPREPVKSSK